MQKEEEASSSSVDLRCVLCRKAVETEITGALSCKLGTAAHQNCLLYASGIYCKNSPTYDDLFGFDVEDVQRERRRGRKLKCHYCNKTGATAGCEVKSCRRSYHYPCAEKDMARSECAGDSFRLYCPKHNPRSVGPVKNGDGKATGLTKNHEQDCSGEGSESNCEIQRRSRKRKTHNRSLSDSDETHSFDLTVSDLEMAPIEWESEDNALPDDRNTERNTVNYAAGSEEYKKQKEGGRFDDHDDEARRDSDIESQSLLEAEYYQENVPFTVIADSGHSVESVAENSLDAFSSAAPSPADLCSSSSVPPNPHAPARPTPDSPPSSSTGVSGGFGADSCRDVAVKIERCESRNQPPLQMSFASPDKSGSAASRPDVSESAAAVFWRRCNEVGCTESIFAELACQLSDLEERVKSRQATQQDYDVSLGILKASGRLPAIIDEMEQDMARQEMQLRRKRKALSDAKAVLEKNQMI